MLYISETKAGVKNLEKKPVTISEIIQKACELFQPTAEDRGITINSNIQTGCIIHGNAHMLQRMIANLLDNALKYTPPKGKVEICLTGNEKTVNISFVEVLF